jgi:hypothetical protein
MTGTIGLGVQGFGKFFFPVSGGTTDGNTFSLSGETSLVAICDSDVQPFTVSGDCGTGVTVSYEEDGATGTFTGDVVCNFCEEDKLLSIMINDRTIIFYSG